MDCPKCGKARTVILSCPNCCRDTIAVPVPDSTPLGEARPADALSLLRANDAAVEAVYARGELLADQAFSARGRLEGTTGAVLGAGKTTGDDSPRRDGGITSPVDLPGVLPGWLHEVTTDEPDSTRVLLGVELRRSREGRGTLTVRAALADLPPRAALNAAVGDLHRLAVSGRLPPDQAERLASIVGALVDLAGQVTP